MTPPRSSRPDLFLLLLLAGSLGFNVWQGMELRQARSGQPPAPRLSVGDALPSLGVVDAGGQSVTLTAGSDPRPTVYYVFSPTCPWCQKNSAAVAALAAQSGERYRLVGLCMSTRESCEASDIRPPFPVYTGVSREAVEELGLGSVPQTIVASPQGKVEQVFRGAWGGTAKQDVERFFSVSLPALATPAGKPAAAQAAQGG